MASGGGRLNCIEIVAVNTKNATVLWTTLGLLRSVDGEPLWHASVAADADVTRCAGFGLTRVRPMNALVSR